MTGELLFMKEGDLICARYSDGVELIGKFVKKERGFIVIEYGRAEIGIREQAATFEIIEKNKNST